MQTMHQERYKTNKETLRSLKDTQIYVPSNVGTAALSLLAIGAVLTYRLGDLCCSLSRLADDALSPMIDGHRSHGSYA